MSSPQLLSVMMGALASGPEVLRGTGKMVNAQEGTDMQSQY